MRVMSSERAMPLNLTVVVRERAQGSSALEAQHLIGVLVLGERFRLGGAHDLDVRARAHHLDDVCIRDASAAGAHTGDQQSKALVRAGRREGGTRRRLDSAETHASAQNFHTVQDTRAGSFISGASRRLAIGGRP